MNNNSILFPQCQLEKPGPVLQDRYEVKKVIEYSKALRTGVQQYTVRWLGYTLENELWIDGKDISPGILHDFWKKGNLENTFKGPGTNNGRPGRYQIDETCTMI